MDRKTFLTAAPAMGALALNGAENASGKESDNMKDYYELRLYHYESEEQKTGIAVFFRDVAIPALNRMGIAPVGIFQPDEDGVQTIYVLIPHRSLESLSECTRMLLADSVYCSDGAAFLDAPAENPSYTRIESSLLMAFTGMPHIDVPAKSAERIVQLRRYESPSVKTGQKKIGMFNTAEIAIFRKTGLNPVFFGEALAGGNMPNLTYMLAFENREQQKAAWKKFMADPDWQELRAMPEYGDKKILSGITNILMIPLAGSQI